MIPSHRTAAQVALVACGVIAGACSSSAAIVDAAAADVRDSAAPDRQRVPDLARRDLPATRDLPRSQPDLRPAPDTAPGCAYVSIDDKVVHCGSSYKSVHHFSAPSSSSTQCPDFWGMTASGPHHASAADAAAASGCDTTCVWSAAISVSMLHCGQKTGFIRFDAPGCPQLFQFPDGYFPSVAAWEAAHPCLDGGTAG